MTACAHVRGPVHKCLAGLLPLLSLVLRRDAACTMLRPSVFSDGICGILSIFSTIDQDQSIHSASSFGAEQKATVVGTSGFHRLAVHAYLPQFFGQTCLLDRTFPFVHLKIRDNVLREARPTKRCIVVVHSTADLWCIQCHVNHMSSDAQNPNNPLVHLLWAVERMQ